MDTRIRIKKGLPFSVLDDPTLFEDMLRGRDKCFALNQLQPSQWSERVAAVKDLFGRTGERMMLHSPFTCEFGYNISIGEDFTCNHNVTILDLAQVTFGDNVFVGPNCGLYTSTHSLDAAERKALLGTAHPITVGDNAWLGGNVVVLPGVTIGENAVVAAGSVVTQDVPANCLAAGNPCRVLRQLDNSSIDPSA